MNYQCRLRIVRADFDLLFTHLFPGDSDEHGAVLLAGMSEIDGRLTLHVREVHLADEGTDYIAGKVGYRALSPKFIHRMITRARDQRLVYLAVHNHGSADFVGFSKIDFDSHERGYPALLQIARGMPVGALVFGTNSLQADIWLPGGERLDLEEASVVGNAVRRLRPQPLKLTSSSSNYDRQLMWFGSRGQMELASCCVGVVGLGGIGSLVVEYLARLGVGKFILIDEDHVESTNLSRIVGASQGDVAAKISKVDVSKRLILAANERAIVETSVSDVAKFSVSKRLTQCDYIFLAADSMRARLVFNAIIHQYLIPGVQLGSKIRTDNSGRLLDIMSAKRPVRPARGCLWCNQFIDPTRLAKEAKTEQERKDQAYGTAEPNPSVITLNAVSAAHAVNDFLLDYLGLRQDSELLHYEHFHHLRGVRDLVQPRIDPHCTECSPGGSRFARGDLIELPAIE